MIRSFILTVALCSGFALAASEGPSLRQLGFSAEMIALMEAIETQPCMQMDEMKRLTPLMMVSLLDGIETESKIFFGDKVASAQGLKDLGTSINRTHFNNEAAQMAAIQEAKPHVARTDEEILQAVGAASRWRGDKKVAHAAYMLRLHRFVEWVVASCLAGKSPAQINLTPNIFRGFVALHHVAGDFGDGPRSMIDNESMIDAHFRETYEVQDVRRILCSIMGRLMQLSPLGARHVGKSSSAPAAWEK